MAIAAPLHVRKLIPLLWFGGYLRACGVEGGGAKELKLHYLLLALSLRAELKHHPVVVTSALVGCAIKVAHCVLGHVSVGKCSIRTAGEAVQNGFDAVLSSTLKIVPQPYGALQLRSPP